MTTTPRTLDADTFRGDMRHVVLWHQLMSEAEELTAATGEALASVWGHVRRGNYVAARSALDELAQEARRLDPQLRKSLDPARIRRRPEAPILEAQTDHGLHTVLVRCPVCQKTHTHGASLGHRAAHCAAPYSSNGYIITDPDHKLPGVKA